MTKVTYGNGVTSTTIEFHNSECAELAAELKRSQGYNVFVS